MQLSKEQPVRRSALPSIGAIVVVVAVVAGNSWWLLHDEPTAPPMSEGERLQVLQDDRERVQQAAEEQEAARAEANRPDNTVATEPKVEKLELSAAQVARRPVVPLPQPIERLASVRPGDSLTSALQRLFIHGPTAYRLVAAYSKLRKPRRLQVGNLLFARFDSPSPMDAESLISLVVAPKRGGKGITIERRREGDKTTYVAKEGGLPGVVERRALRCAITASLSRSLQRCGHGPSLASLVSSGLAARLSLRSDVRRGDEARIVYDELVAAGEHVRYERVLAIRYRGERKLLTGIWFDDRHGRADWFLPSGAALEPMFTTSLVAGARLTSGFGMRLHPILGVRKMHNGTDYAAASGTPVRAAADGTIVKASSGGAAGNHLRIKHQGGYLTEYMHLSRFSRRSRPAKKILKGQVIGYVGSTGRSTAPHLHFGVIKGGSYVDPMSIREVAGIGVAGRYKARFDRHAEEVMKLLDALDKDGSGDS
jgi:murein DD-endopeptidase MepM/ murein hydrolase activator NlpD